MKRMLKGIKARLGGGSFMANVMVLAGGAGLGQFLVVLATPFLTRLYSPEDFGVLAVYASILSIILITASLRYEVAIPLPEKDESAANLLALCFFILTTESLLCVAGIWLFREQVTHWLNCASLKPYLLLLPLSLFWAGTYKILNCWALRRKTFSRIARTKLTQSFGQVLTQLGAGFLYAGPLGLLLGDVVGRASGSGTLACLAFRQDGKVIKGVSLFGIRKVLKRYWRFPIISSGAAMLNGLGVQLPPLLLAGYYGAGVAGLFALGQRILGLPLGLLSNSVAQVYLAETAKMATSSPQKIRSLFWDTMKKMFVMGIIVISFFMLILPWLFSTVFGNQWSESEIYLRILGPMFLFQLTCSPIGGTLDVLERQDLAMIREVIRVSLTAVALIMAGVSNQPPVMAVTFLSIAASIGYIIYAFMSWLAIRSFLASKEQGGTNVKTS